MCIHSMKSPGMQGLHESFRFDCFKRCGDRAERRHTTKRDDGGLEIEGCNWRQN